MGILAGNFLPLLATHRTTPNRRTLVTEHPFWVQQKPDRARGLRWTPTTRTPSSPPGSRSAGHGSTTAGVRCTTFSSSSAKARVANTSRGRFTPPAKTTRAKHTRKTTPTSPSWRFTNETIPPCHRGRRATSHRAVRPGWSTRWMQTPASPGDASDCLMFASGSGITGTRETRKTNNVAKKSDHR